MPKQIHASLFRIQLHRLSFNLFPCRKFFLTMYLTCKQSDVSRRDSRSLCVTVRAGVSLLTDATGRDAEALKRSLEQEGAFLVERTSKKIR